MPVTTIRLAEARDLPHLAAIEDAGDRLFAERFGALDWPPASTGEERAAEPGFLLVAAEDESGVVGFAQCWISRVAGTSNRLPSTRRTVAGASAVGSCARYTPRWSAEVAPR
jgi:hypothetical protein